MPSSRPCGQRRSVRSYRGRYDTDAASRPRPRAHGRRVGRGRPDGGARGHARLAGAGAPRPRPGRGARGRVLAPEARGPRVRRPDRGGPGPRRGGRRLALPGAGPAAIRDRTLERAELGPSLVGGLLFSGPGVPCRAPTPWLSGDRANGTPNFGPPREGWPSLFVRRLARCRSRGYPAVSLLLASRSSGRLARGGPFLARLSGGPGSG